MKSRLFQTQQGIIPHGLQYVIRTYDKDIFKKNVVFNGITLIFDASANMEKFRTTFHELPNSQLRALQTFCKNIGDFKNEQTFCILDFRVNSYSYFLSRKSNITTGDILYAGLIKDVQLANIPVLDFDFNRVQFMDSEYHYSDAPNNLKCPISGELMEDPVTVSTGITYNRRSLIALFSYHGYPDKVTCPITDRPIEKKQLKAETCSFVKALTLKYKASKDEVNEKVECKF